MTTPQHLALIPRDGLFCKDGRGWHTSASGRGHSLEWPWPSTILGALRTAWGRLEQSRTGKIFSGRDWRERTAPIRLGRTLVLRRAHGAVSWKADGLIWPAPMDALRLEGQTQLYRLKPVEAVAPTLGRDDDTVRESLWWPQLDSKTKPLPPARWWTHADLARWLAGGAVDAPERAPAPSRRLQAHVGIEPETLTARDSILFSHDVIETLEADAEWAVGVEVSLPVGTVLDVATLGSDGRLSRIEALTAALFEAPVELLNAFRAGSRGLWIMAVTPVCFERGWLPDGLEAHGGEYRGQLPGFAQELTLRSAFVSRPIHVSGWDLAEGRPKPTSRMVPAGSVYFFERTDGQPFGEADARALWLAALGARTDEGFGRVIPGTWTPGESIR